MPVGIGILVDVQVIRGLPARITRAMRSRSLIILVLTLLASLGFAQRGKDGIREKPFVPPKRWAIVIGAQEYAEFGRLKYAAKDAKDFAKLLIDDLDFQPDTVRLITDAPESGLKPTAETIQSELKAKLADGRLDKGDLFIFFFAGHGVGTPKGDFLLPTNATKSNVEEVGVRAKDIVEAFVAAGLKNVLVIADACRSGEKNTFGSELYELGDKANIGVLLGCAPGARSYEYPGLGHGAFTNFLMKAIRDKENVSKVSGALWVSRLAQDVKDKVRVYTERDYPTNPQIPTMETRETHDILLGAYPSLANLSEASKAMLAESKKLTPDAFRSAILDYAQIFYVNDLNADSIDLLRAGDAVFQLSPEDRYILAMNLEQLGRTEESQREFTKIQNQTENELYRYLATLLNPSRKIDPKTRVEAAQKAWKLEPTEYVAKIAWAALRISASSADVNTFLKQILDSPLMSGRARMFLESEQLGNAGDWDGAYKKLEACRALEGDYPDDYALDASLLTAKIKLAKTDDLEAFFNDAILRSPKMKGKWLLLLADFQDELGNKDAAFATVQRALKTPLEPDDLLHCIRLASLRYLQLKIDILVQVKRYPLAWKARLAEFWLTKLGQADAQAQMDMLTKEVTFCDDPFSLLFECYRMLDIQLEDALKLKAISDQQYLQLMIAYSSDMIQNVDKFGYDVFPWMLLVKFSLMCERYEQLKLLFDYKLGPMLDNGTIDPLLRAPYLFAALSVGDEARTAKIWQLRGFHPSDLVDAGWVLAMDRALRGDLAGATSLIPNQAASAPYRGAVLGFRAYLDVRSGKVVDLALVIKQLNGDPAGTQFVALAYAHLGKWANSLPLLKALYTQRVLSLTFLQAKVCQVYFDQLIASKKYDLAREVAYDMSISGYGNPLYSKIHFGEKPSIESFAGKTSYEAASLDFVSEMTNGSLDLEITLQGGVAGKLVLATKPYIVAGNVDAYGNVSATVRGEGKLWNLTGKIAPASEHNKVPRFATIGQALLLLEPNGQGRYLFARPR